MWSPRCTDDLLSQVQTIFPNQAWEVITNEARGPLKKHRKVAFYLQSDTLVKSALPMLQKLSDALILIPEVHPERADVQLKAEGLEYHIYGKQLLKKHNIGLLVLFNDWTKLAKRAIIHARSLRIPSLCVQESMIDFASNQRMQFADAVAIQGSFYLKKLRTKHYFLTGNPRYEHLQIETAAKPTQALINCNFTYGIFEEWRTEWLQAIVQALEGQNTDYCISQHPRDQGDLSSFKNVLPSSAATVQQQLATSTLVITRFSSLIHEAICLGVPVIYYNPHGETMVEQVEIDGHVVREIRDSNQLSIAIRSVQNHPFSKADFEAYVQRNCFGLGASLPSQNLIHIMQRATLIPRRNNLREVCSLLYYTPVLRRMSLWIRNRA